MLLFSRLPVLFLSLVLIALPVSEFAHAQDETSDTVTEDADEAETTPVTEGAELDENSPDTRTQEEIEAAIGLIASTSASTPTNGEAESLVPTYEIPGNVRSDGAFNYKVGFDIPEFRDLEPNLGLAYKSSFNGRGRAEVYLGVGWQLQGFSSIERISVGGGTPSYDDNDFNSDDGSEDIFRLDGSDLMACDDSSATNPWSGSWVYPEKYRTEVSSASCLAGGNMSTLVESYRKIEMKYETIGAEQLEYFVVTRGDGTQYKYESLGVLAGDTPDSSSADFDILFRRKFVLSEITDVQSTPNKVEYSYSFSDVSDGRAHRPESVEYGGYVVKFFYSSEAEPLATYAVGSATRFGNQKYRLSSVVVKDGSTQIRAYGLEYTQSPIVGANRLKKVRAFGSDYVRLGNDIVSGSELPNLIKGMQYNSDNVALTKQVFTGKKFRRGLKVIDIERDGSDDLLFLTSAVSGYPFPAGTSGCSSEIPFPPTSGFQQKINVGANGARTVTVDTARNSYWWNFQIPANPGDHTHHTTTAKLVGLLPFTNNLGNSFLIAEEKYWENVHDGNEETGSADTLQGMLPFTDNGQLSSSFLYYRLGNFDDDAEFEIFVSKSNSKFQLYDFDGSSTSPKWPTSYSMKPGGGFSDSLVLDVDGDGQHEQLILRHTGYTTPPISGTDSTNAMILVKFNQDGIQQQTYIPETSQEQGSPKTVAADMNGDGRDDLVFIKKSAIKVALSTGKGFYLFLNGWTRKNLLRWMVLVAGMSALVT